MSGWDKLVTNSHEPGGRLHIPAGTSDMSRADDDNPSIAPRQLERRPAVSEAAALGSIDDMQQPPGGAADDAVDVAPDVC